jgi:hypothetical protein
MANYNRIKGDYTLKTLNLGSNVVLDTSNVRISGNVSATGNIVTNLSTASFFIGDGGFLSNINVSNASVVSTRIANGTSNVSIPVSSGNITFGVSGTDNVIVVSTVGANIATGTTSTSNITGALKVTGGVGVAGNVYADAVYSNNAAVLTANSVINGGTY